MFWSLPLLRSILFFHSLFLLLFFGFFSMLFCQNEKLDKTLFIFISLGEIPPRIVLLHLSARFKTFWKKGGFLYKKSFSASFWNTLPFVSLFLILLLISSGFCLPLCFLFFLVLFSSPFSFHFFTLFSLLFPFWTHVFLVPFSFPPVKKCFCFLFLNFIQFCVFFNFCEKNLRFEMSPWFFFFFFRFLCWFPFSNYISKKFLKFWIVLHLFFIQFLYLLFFRIFLMFGKMSRWCIFLVSSLFLFFSFFFSFLFFSFLFFLILDVVSPFLETSILITLFSKDRLQKSRESMTVESRWGPRSKMETRIALKANQRASTEAKDFSKSEIEQGMSCTHSRAWLRSLRRRWPRMALSRTRTPSIQWTALVTSQTTEQVLTRIEDAHNIVDMKYSMFPRSENCSEIQGQTRQHSKLINLLEVEQIYSCANKIDRDTSGSKKSATRSRTRWRACRSRISSKRTPTTRRNVGEHLVIRGDHWEWLRLRARCSASSRGALLQSHPGLCVFSWVPARTPMVHGSPYAGRPCVPDNKSPRDTTKTMTRPSLQCHVWRALEYKHGSGVGSQSHRSTKKSSMRMTRLCRTTISRKTSHTSSTQWKSEKMCLSPGDDRPGEQAPQDAAESVHWQSCWCVCCDAATVSSGSDCAEKESTKQRRRLLSDPWRVGVPILQTCMVTRRERHLKWKLIQKSSWTWGDKQVSDEDGYLSRSSTIKVNSKIVKERILPMIPASPARLSFSFCVQTLTPRQPEERVISVRTEAEFAHRVLPARRRRWSADTLKISCWCETLKSFQEVSKCTDSADDPDDVKWNSRADNRWAWQREMEYEELHTAFSRRCTA